MWSASARTRGSSPDPASIQDGSFFFFRNCGAVRREALQRPEVKAFMEFGPSMNQAAISKASNIVSMTDTQQAAFSKQGSTGSPACPVDDGALHFAAYISLIRGPSARSRAEESDRDLD